MTEDNIISSEDGPADSHEFVRERAHGNMRVHPET
jgi:hypothetical protein